jgi:hypothetical protein
MINPKVKSFQHKNQRARKAKEEKEEKVKWQGWEEKKKRQKLIKPEGFDSQTLFCSPFCSII